MKPEDLAYFEEIFSGVWDFFRHYATGSIPETMQEKKDLLEEMDADITEFSEDHMPKVYMCARLMCLAADALYEYWGSPDKLQKKMAEAKEWKEKEKANDKS